MSKTLLVTGGAGFIGSALVHHLIAETDHRVVTVDKLTYAGHRASLAEVEGEERHHFERVDIAEPGAVAALFDRYRPDGVIHLAAETHVDRSIDGPGAFIRTNVVGTFTLLEAARAHLPTREPAERDAFRFVSVSTDEVFGSLGPEGYFREDTPYDPRSPYSASKASADHMAMAYFHTYGLPVIVTNCSNNYGPRQHPEKLIPTVILKALAGDPIPIYGSGTNVRDWLYVGDHVRAILTAFDRGTPGDSYAVGTNNERTSLEMAEAICALLDRLRPDGAPYARLIRFVEDRPGHDFRYAIDASKIRRELGWQPQESFDSGLERTVHWYLNHLDWIDTVTGGGDLARLGLGDG
jgi:dTDP-glucose 4,6-dehydratase